MAVAISMFVGAAILFSCSLFLIIGLSTPDWTLSEESFGERTIKEKFGPFKVCVNDDCESFNEMEISSDLKAVRALGVISMLLSLVAVICSVVFVALSLMNWVYSLWIPVASFTAAVLSGCLSVTTIVVFAVLFHSGSKDYGFSFVLFLIGGLVIGLTGPFFYYASKKQLKLMPRRPLRYLAGPTDYQRMGGPGFGPGPSKEFAPPPFSKPDVPQARSSSGPKPIVSVSSGEKSISF